MKRSNRCRCYGKVMLFACSILAIILCTGVPPVPASTCVDCHTDESSLGKNLSKVKAKKSTVTSKRSAVAFPHSRHFGYTCRTCHHKWDGYAPVRGCTATGCHDRIASQKKNVARGSSKVHDSRYYKAAYHQNCLGCHRRLTLERQKLEMTKAALGDPLPKTGPTGCNGCHSRN